ncbi:nitrogen regulation protein NR(II) [Acidipila sp. EB88]|uniref:two-component system sensor histidine kinase NtrB n=1 Tax=Acidipila sp. EB88 TaxID=2305226 RepID=UPI000F6039AF|nr:ATP-binding protein [Acidipila sp. EB88]RRA48157.1 PAS domain S-box protein [Acidipila sp. EB88]
MPDDRTNLAPPEQLSWQALLDSAGEGIWGVDLDGRCTFVNRSALAMLGYEDASELIGREMHAMVHHHYPDGSVYPSAECVVYNVFRKSHAVKNYVDHLFRKDGSLFWTELSAQPIVDGRDAEGGGGVVRGAVVTFRDVTQARLAEAALRRSEKLAAVGQLASSIAHEINNPLEAITNLLYLIRTSTSLEAVQTFATVAEAELARVADITIQTLRFHRQQSAAAPLDLAETMRSVLRLYTSRFTARKIEAKLKLGTLPTALLFEGEIRQVLNNLLRNAYDAMARGGSMHVRIRSAVSPRSGRPGIRITVADEGTGFLPAMRMHLFEPFHTSKEATGTGLGLWISKGIVDKHQGTIRMRSRLETECRGSHGTVFVLWLPLQPESPADPAKPRAT